jgi:carbon monoxide dehydrogenase subunit G
MAEVNATVPLPLAPDAAWALLSDLSRFDQWLTIHDKWSSDIPELAVGARVTEQLTVMGMTNKIDWTVDVFDPPASLKISGVGLAGAQIAFTMSVAAADAGSEVTIDAEFTGQMMVGAIGDAVAKNALVELEASLTKLRELAG